jgi:voltage-gated potassium channel
MFVASTIIIAYVTAVIVVFIFGMIGTYVLGHYDHGFNVQIDSLTTAAYFTIITISTVGYGDIVPVTRAARIFVMILIVSGLGVFISSATGISSEIMNRSIERRMRGNTSFLERKLLRNHIVLIGADSVNMRIAEKLKVNKKKFIFITSDKVTSDALRAQGYNSYVSDETSEEDMRVFNLNKAQAIIVDMRDKSRIVYNILVVRSLAKDSKIVAIAHTKSEERNLRSLSASIGIINPSAIVSDIITKRLMEEH